MPSNQFINLEELSKTTQALLSKINEQSNLKVNKDNVRQIVTSGTKIAEIEDTEIYTPEIDTSNLVTQDQLNDLYDDLANVAYSGSYSDLSNTPILPIITITPPSSGQSPCPATIMGQSLPLTQVYPGISSGVGGDIYFYLTRLAAVTSGSFSIKLNNSTCNVKVFNNTGTQESNNIGIGPGLFYGHFYYERNTYSFTIYRDTQANNALTVKGHIVDSNVPADAVFTDTVYDDTAISSRISTLENAGYQNSTQVNSAIATAIGNINQFEVAIITDLPTADIDTHTIYFKSNSSSGNNIYDEYMYINNNWELIGSTQIDLTPYALSIDVPEAESNSNVEAMLDSFNLDYNSNSTSLNEWQGGSY